MGSYDDIVQAKQGDRDAWGRLYDDMYVPIYRYIFSRLRHKEMTEDIVHDVFVKFFKALDGFQPKEDSSPLRYCYTIARNTLTDYFRTMGRELDYDEEELKKLLVRTQHVEEFSKEEARDTVYTLLDLLPGEHRDVLVMKFLNGYSNREIAELTGKTEEALRQMQSRALKKLRFYFKEYNLM